MKLKSYVSLDTDWAQPVATASAQPITRTCLPGIICFFIGIASGQRPLAIVEHQTYFLDLGAQGAVFEFEQCHDRPLIVPDQAQDFDDGGVALAEGRAAAVVLSPVAQMHARDAFMVAFEEAQAIPIGGGVVSDVQGGLEVRRESEPFLKSLL